MRLWIRDFPSQHTVPVSLRLWILAPHLSACLYLFKIHTLEVTTINVGFLPPFSAGIIFYPQRLDGLITFQALRMGFWAMTISNHTGNHHSALVKEETYKGWNHLWHSWNGPEAMYEGGGACVRVSLSLCVYVCTVCVYVCINGCFAPLIMPWYQLRPEDMRGRASCDWLMCCAILSDSESPFTAVAYWCYPGGVQGKRHLHVNKACV